MWRLILNDFCDNIFIITCSIGDGHLQDDAVELLGQVVVVGSSLPVEKFLSGLLF